MERPPTTIDRTDLFVTKNLRVPSAQAVAMLRDVRLRLAVDPATAGTRNGQIAAVAAANTLGRTPNFAPHVHVDVPPEVRVADGIPFIPEGLSLRSELVNLLARVAAFTPSETNYAPAGRGPYDITLVIGSAHKDAGPGAVYSTYAGWTASISILPSRDPHAPIDDPNNPLGAVLAGTWGAAEALKRLFVRVKNPSVHVTTLSAEQRTARVSAWQDTDGEALDGPRLPQRIDFGTFSLIGAGALGGCVGFVLNSLPSPTGRVHVCDFDVIERHSGNRLATAVPEDVGLNKAEHLVGVLSDRDFEAQAWRIPFGEFARRVGPDGLDTVLVGVDNVSCRRDAQFEVPRFLINGGTVDAEFLVSTHIEPGSGPCLACLYPRSSEPRRRADFLARARMLTGGACARARIAQNLPAGTISFVSMMPAVFMVAELVKDRLGHHAARRSSFRMNTFLLPSMDIQISFRPARHCLCGTDAYVRRYRDKWVSR